MNLRIYHPEAKLMKDSVSVERSS